MLTDLSLSCKHSGTGPPREYTLTHTPHILFTPTIALSSSHLAHASEQSKMVKLRRWPSIKSHARSIHASRWVVEDWTWIAVARYWSSNDVSPCFRESLVRNYLPSTSINYLFSARHFIIFPLKGDRGAKLPVASLWKVKTKFQSLTFFEWQGRFVGWVQYTVGNRDNQWFRSHNSGETTCILIWTSLSSSWRKGREEAIDV